MANDFQFQNFFTFEKMIAPTVIKIVYWIGLVVLTLGALGALFGGGGHMGGFLGRFIGVLVAYVVGILFWRIIMELYIVLFGIYDRLGEIRDRTNEKPEA